jgi:hypothetical protein
VINILPSAGGVFASRLQHPARSSIDCYFFPGWWNSERVDPGKIVTSHFTAVGGDISKTTLGSESQNPGLL